MYPALQRTDTDLQAYLLALGDDIADVLADASRTLLINVDPVAVPAQTAESIGAIVRALVGALGGASERNEGVIEIGCGANRDGGLTLAISDESANAKPEIASQRIANLVSYFGTRMAIESNGRLRCTVAIPAQFTL